MLARVERDKTLGTHSMKQTNLGFKVIGSYYALTYVLHFWRFESFLKDVLVAPLYFLVPTGFGLLIFSIFCTHQKILKSVTRLQLILSSTFLGFVLISLAYTELNNDNKLPGVFFAAYPFFNLFSLLGFYQTREVLEIDDSFWSLIKTILLVLPISCAAYYFHYVHFSPFPLRDIFQEVHFMKGALEFSNFQIINIATGDSYIALLQVHSGLLNHFFAYNLINSQWILLAYLFLFGILCYYCFLSSFIENRFMLNVTLGLATLSIIFSNSNNEYLLGLTLVFFAVLVSKNKERTKAAPVFLELVVLCVLSIIFYLNRMPTYPRTALPHLVFYLLFMLLLSYFDFDRVLPLVFAALLMLIAPPYHRAASLYIPLMLLLYGIYFVSFQWRRIDTSESKRTLLRKVVLYSIIVPPAGVAVSILIAYVWPSSHLHLTRALDWICLAMVGQTTAMNQGIVATAAAWLKLAPPIFHLLFLLLIIKLFKERHTALAHLHIESNLSYIIFCWLASGIFIIFYFSPLPNIHRMIPFPILMLFALMAFLLKFCWDSYARAGDYSRSVLLVPGFAIAYTLIARLLYDVPWRYPDVKSPYVAALFPITEIGIATMLVILLTLILRQKMSLAAVFTLVVLSLGLMVDRFNLIAKLYGPSYGYVSHEPTVISHYSLLDLRTAERLRPHFYESHGYVLMSDPYTLGILEARTGINGFYSFSNLGLMSESYKNDIRAILRTAFPDIDSCRGQPNRHAIEAVVSKRDEKVSGDILAQPDYETKNRQVLRMLAEFIIKNRGAYPEAEYALQTKLRLPFYPQAAECDSRWIEFIKDRMLWVINEKTIRWAYGQDSYYPMNGAFTENYVDKYIAPYFKIVLNVGNKIFVLKLR
jgi:hypothetical protein